MAGVVDDSAGRDVEAAQNLVGKASEHVEDAEREVNHGSSRFLLAYQAALDLMNAVLKAAGKKVTSGPGGHIARIDGCKAELPGAAELWERIDDARQRRNRIAYDGMETDADLVEAFAADLKELTEKVKVFIRDAETAQQYEWDNESGSG